MKKIITLPTIIFAALLSVCNVTAQAGYEGRVDAWNSIAELASGLDPNGLNESQFVQGLGVVNAEFLSGNTPNGTTIVASVIDGDFTWELDTSFLAGSGDISKSGTPLNNQISVFNSEFIIEGDPNFTWNSANSEFLLNGSQVFSHTSTFSDDHALEIDLNANGFGDSKALDIDYITGALATGSGATAILVNFDDSAAIGGSVAGLAVLSTVGNSMTYGVGIGAGVNPLIQQVGSFGDMDYVRYTTSGGGEVDGLADFISSGSDVTLFTADNDYVIIGNAAVFTEIEFLFDTFASGAGIQPNFEFSTGGSGFTAFVPLDGTNGMKNNGDIAWLIGGVSGWATNTSGNFEIKITRTQNGLATSPIEDLVQISETTELMWDSNGLLTIIDINLAGTIVSVPGAYDGDDIQGDSIDDDALDFGLGTDQIAAGDIPINDVGNFYTTDDVNNALQQIGDGVTGLYRTDWIGAGAMIPQATSPAFAVTVETASFDINYDQYLFDGAVTEAVQFAWVIPEIWDLTNLKMKLYWSASTGATPGDLISFNVKAVTIGNDDPLDKTFVTTVEVDDVVLAVGDLHITSASATIPPGGTEAPGDLLVFHIERDHDDTADNMVEDLILLGVFIQWKESETETTAW